MTYVSYPRAWGRYHPPGAMGHPRRAQRYWGDDAATGL